MVEVERPLPWPALAENDVNHPKIVVAANDPENSSKAASVEAVVNHLWRHHDFQTPFRRAVKDFLIFGHGWLKVGWKFVEQEMSLSDVQRQDLLDQAINEVDMFAAEAPAFAGGLPTDEEVAANVPQTAMMGVEDQPFGLWRKVRKTSGTARQCESS